MKESNEPGPIDRLNPRRLLKNLESLLPNRPDPPKEDNAPPDLGDLSVRLAKLETLLAGLDRTDITGKDGLRWTIPAEPIGRERLGEGAWSLVSVGSNRFSVEVGEVYASYSDWENPLEVQNRGASFTLSSDRRVWLELDLTDPSNLELSLESGDQWDEYPKNFKEQEEGNGLKRIVTAYFKLWEFSDEARTRRSEFQVTDRLIARQFVSRPHSLIMWGEQNLDTRGWQRVMVPVLVPLS